MVDVDAETPLVWFNRNARESRSPGWQNLPSVQTRQSSGQGARNQNRDRSSASGQTGVIRPMEKKIRVLICDDHALFREGVKTVLSAQPDIEVVGEAADGKEAVVQAIRLYPHVVLLDISMPVLKGFDAVRRIRKARPDVKAVFLGMRHPNPAIGTMEMAERACGAARELGLEGRSVFFVDWVPYDERQNYLLEADVGVSLHQPGVEAQFAYRTRVLDYLWAGLPMVLSRDRTPRAVLVDFARTGATVFPGMPVFYQAFREINDVPALPKLRLCISAGAPLPVNIAQKFRKKFRLPIHSFYGASECGGICYDCVGIHEIEGFVGQPMKGVDVEIVDAAVGASQIRVRSAAVSDGYFPEADAKKLGNGIFVPDDLLARDNCGFKIVGRVSDMINVAGKKVNPAEVEAQLLRFGGVRHAVVFGRPAAAGALRNEEVAACLVVDVEPSTELRTGLREKDLQEFCRNALSAWQVPKRIFFVNAIPVNERGKISRRELARRFAAEE